MRTQWSFLIFILGFLWGSHWAVTPDREIIRHPQNVLSKEVGTYYLVNGTQGCPSQLDWSDECNGFVLKPKGKIQQFLNCRNFATSTRAPKSLAKAWSKDTNDCVSKFFAMTTSSVKDTTVYIDKNESVSLTSEDSLIFARHRKIPLGSHPEWSRHKLPLLQRPVITFY